MVVQNQPKPLIFLSPDFLRLHPRNIRIYYPETDVAEMARSLAAVGESQPAGNIQALLVVPAETDGAYYVVDGNLRLMAGRSLGRNCPPLKCEVIGAGQAEQLLLMAATSIHFPKDAISEARHYRRLIDDEGYSQADIARLTGLSASTISHRLALLDLDDRIQRYIIERKLPADIRLIRALRNIPDREQQVSIAAYYAKRDVAIGSMMRHMRKLAERAHIAQGKGEVYRQERERMKARSEAGHRARRADGQQGIDEESRMVIWRLAGEFLCDGCRLDGLKAECYLCPGPQEFIEHLVELAEVATQTERG